MDHREEENNLVFGKSLWNLKKKQTLFASPWDGPAFSW